MTRTTDLLRSGLRTLRLALAKKRRLHDWQMLTVYWAMEIWTTILNLSNPESNLYQLFFGQDATFTEAACFSLFFITSNVLYLFVWLADPGYVIVSLNKEMTAAQATTFVSDSSSPEKVLAKSAATAETAGLLKRASIPTSQHVAVDIDGSSAPPDAAHDGNYCYLCDHTIPPRAHHCRHCDRCVAKFDHHCPFLNNCVGARTHSAFTAYCFCQSVVMAYAIVSLFGMIRLFEADTDVYMNCLYALTTIGCVFLFATSAFLSIGHFVLAVKNLTTWEYLISMRIRQQKWRGQAPRYAPPGNYDQGCLKNLLEDCSTVPRPEYVFATRIVRHNAAWDGTDDVEIDTFDAELDSIQPLTVHGLSTE